MDLTVNEPRTLGPDGASGLFIAYQTPSGALPRLIAYKPEEQTWHCCGVNGAFWVGIDKASPPTPEDMRRRKIVWGYFVRLADGNDWHVPIFRKPDGSTELPRDFIVDHAGELREEIKRDYLAHWDASAETADWFYGKGRAAESFSMVKAISRSIDVLGVNYRFGRAEQAALRLIDSTNWEVLLGSTVDLPKVLALEEQKKRESEESSATNTLPGSTDDSLDTDPAAENSTFQQAT